MSDKRLTFTILTFDIKNKLSVSKGSAISKHMRLNKALYRYLFEIQLQYEIIYGEVELIV